MHKKLIKKIINDGKASEMEVLEDVLLEALDFIKSEDCERYKALEYDLYESAYDGHLDEELAHEWVSRMKNSDGSVGEHWSIEQTTQYAGNHNKYDWYVVLNMMYSDMYNSKFGSEDYIALAKAWLDDSDVKEHKLLKYFFFIVK